VVTTADHVGTHLVVVMLLPIWRELRVRATVCVDLSDVVDAVHQVLLFVLNLEESGDLVKCFVFSFGNFFVGEDPEDGQEHTKGKEGVVLQHRLHGGEAYGNKKVGTPVDEHRNGHSSRPGTLREELGSDHPGYGAWPDGKENNVEESRNYRQPPNPTHKLLDKEGDGDEDGEDEHPSQTIQMERSSSTPVHKRDRNKGHENHDGSDSDCCVFGRSLAQTSCDE